MKRLGITGFLLVGLFGLVGLALVGCADDDGSTPDASSVDATSSGDGTSGGGDGGVDAATGDTGAGDAKASSDGLGDQGIQPDAASRCSSRNLGAFKLDPAYCVVYRFALPASPTAFGFDDNRVFIFAESQTPKNFLVLEHVIDKSQGTLKAATSFMKFTVSSSETLFGSQYLALAPGGQIAVGYNTSNPTSPVGEVFVGAKSAQPTAMAADGNFDAAWLDATTLLVNGAGAGTLKGQGVYALKKGAKPVLVVGGLGDFSGVVSVGKTVVYVGGYFSKAAEARVYAFTRKEVVAALAGNKTLTAAADGDLAYSGNLLNGSALGDDLVVARADKSFAFSGVGRYAATVAGDKVSFAKVAAVLAPESGANAGTFGQLRTYRSSLLLQYTDAKKAPALAVLELR